MTWVLMRRTRKLFMGALEQFARSDMWILSKFCSQTFGTWKVRDLFFDELKNDACHPIRFSLLCRKISYLLQPPRKANVRCSLCFCKKFPCDHRNKDRLRAFLLPYLTSRRHSSIKRVVYRSSKFFMILIFLFGSRHNLGNVLAKGKN